MPKSTVSSDINSPRAAGVSDVVPSTPRTPREQLLEQAALPTGTPFTPPEASLDGSALACSQTSPDTQVR